VEGRSTTLLDLLALLSSLLDTLGEDSLVLGLSLLGVLSTALLESQAMTLALEDDRGHKALDLGGLGVGLLLGVLGLNLTTDDILANIIILGQVEELADVTSTLGSEALRNGGVSETGNVLLTLLDDGDREDRHVGANDASTDGLALALTGAAGAVARVTLGQQEADTIGQEDTLLHGETLLVVTSSDAEDVALELVAEGVARDLSRDALVVEDTSLTLIIEVDGLLAASGWVGNVQFFLTITTNDS
jgi:hypothetical protein